jgi:hypothetical protein
MVSLPNIFPLETFETLAQYLDAHLLGLPGIDWPSSIYNWLEKTSGKVHGTPYSRFQPYFSTRDGT